MKIQVASEVENKVGLFLWYPASVLHFGLPWHSAMVGATQKVVPWGCPVDQLVQASTRRNRRRDDWMTGIFIG